MLCIGLYEPDMERCRQMRERIVGYSLRENMDISVYYIVDGTQKVEKYANSLQIALISMDADMAIPLARRVYRANPDCRIGYYKSEACDLEPALAARPFTFYRWEKDGGSFDRKLDEVLEDILSAGGIFRYETRKTSLTLPVRDILYFQSNLKNVQIHTRTAEQPHSIFCKLADLERLLETQGLACRFLRIHQSYIVNRCHIRLLNKTEHQLLLNNGEQLPISNGYYHQVQSALTGMKSRTNNQE